MLLSWFVGALNQQVMNDWIVWNCWKNFHSFIINIVQTTVTSPILSGKHLTPFMNEVATACHTYFFLFIFINIGPTLHTSWNKIIIILWRFLWDVISHYLLTFFRLNKKNFFPTVWACFIEFPPSSCAIKTAKLMFTVKNNMIWIHLI